MKFSAHTALFQSVEAVCDYIAPLRATGKTIATTNGCFDLLHAGHVQYLYEAAALGDLLVVGINSDASVRRLKGEHRPVQDQTTRAQVMAALRMVDAVFIFNEQDPRTFIEKIRPDVHVKGGDYGRDIIERSAVESYGGVLKIVSLVDGLSTTNIVDKIKKAPY